ncbi:hypothetical protein [Nostoc sp.]|uniref:hypothetical protein n=1 Tax=Nostoc sp. TaxID=1180 RepID=UPI002FF65CED
MVGKRTAFSIDNLNQGGNGTGIANSGSLNTENGEDAIAGTGNGGNGGGGIISNAGTGTGFNNNGNPISFTTTGVEKFIFADSSFCYSTLANEV